MILRIEDIDSPRIKAWATQQAIDDLRWLGIGWDQGPDVGGEHAPYVQTQRTQRYDDAIQRLLPTGRIYPCTCTRRDIEEAASAPHDHDGPPIYPGTCADWKLGDKLPSEGTYCWRFRVRDQTLRFQDGVAGAQSLNPAAQLGDFPITRKSGLPAYQFAVVVDDADMGVTEVVRGDDLIDSTHWQLELYEALQFEPPCFVHLPLVVGPDGRRLAKRHGDTRLSHLREHGVQATQVIRWAAKTLGISCEVPEGSDVDALHEAYAKHLRWADVNRERTVVPPAWTRMGHD